MVFAPDSGKEPNKHVGYRVRKSLADYVDERAAGQYGGKTRIVEDALELHRSLFDSLAKLKPRLKSVAIDLGLEWPRQTNDLLISLIEKGLEAMEKK